ncbi:LamG domain-containing protein [Flammeovirga agarivorans]|uniref:LamG domain-containing protein n=1 Tax=Flammeovirga agarivorans TaxID=2726742 RepID=A0A7X8SM29_9BACT|nr:LamG domain-containing protein [Flammeovirga agarivorans]NLR92632.1 LamG domain-containing protein [Flammeovirga agarivorans]
MLKLSKLFFAIISIATFFSCTTESEKSSPVQKVKFSFSESSSSARSLEGEAASFVISISQGEESVYHLESLDIINVGGSYLSEELTLEVGEYSITDFVVMNENDEAIYLTPKQGSDFSHLVSKPLPLKFNVSTNDSLTITLEVIEATLGELNDFGYSSFSFEIVDYLSKGLQLYLPFDGSTSDYSENGIELTENGSIDYVQDRKGKEASAIYLNGSDAFLSGDALIRDYKEFTLSAWIKPSTFDVQYTGIFGQSPGTFPAINDYLVLYTTRSQYHPRNGGFGWTLFFQDNTWLDARYLYKHEPGDWILITSTFDGKVFKNYINTTLVSEHFVEEGKMLGNDYKLLIGKTYAYPQNPNRVNVAYFEGAIDEYRIYSRSLSQQEIYQLISK